MAVLHLTKIADTDKWLLKRGSTSKLEIADYVKIFSVTSVPTADSTTEGCFAYVKTSGQKGKLYFCMKKSDNNYECVLIGQTEKDANSIIDHQDAGSEIVCAEWSWQDLFTINRTLAVPYNAILNGSFRFEAGSVEGFMCIRFFIDDVQYGYRTHQIPASTGYRLFLMNHTLLNLSAVAHTIKLQYYSSTNTAKIYERTLDVLYTL